MSPASLRILRLDLVRVSAVARSSAFMAARVVALPSFLFAAIKEKPAARMMVVGRANTRSVFTSNLSDLAGVRFLS